MCDQKHILLVRFCLGDCFTVGWFLIGRLFVLIVNSKFFLKSHSVESPKYAYAMNNITHSVCTTLSRSSTSLYLHNCILLLSITDAMHLYCYCNPSNSLQTPNQVHLSQMLLERWTKLWQQCFSVKNQEARPSEVQKKGSNVFHTWWLHYTLQSLLRVWLAHRWQTQSLDS